MNYSLKNKNIRSLHVVGRENNCKGVVYPSLAQIFNRLKNGNDVAEFLRESPFEGGTAEFIEFDELIKRNKFYLSELEKSFSILEKNNNRDANAEELTNKPAHEETTTNDNHN